MFIENKSESNPFTTTMSTTDYNYQFLNINITFLMKIS